MYQDSFGNIVPAALDALAAGIVPPPIVVPVNQAPPTQDAAARRNIGYDVAQDRRERLTPDDNPPCTGTYVSNTTIPNILPIMVDQLRSPRWVPTTGGQAYLDTLTPNIAQLRNHSAIFSNYFTAATKCTPSRATLLTGLYSQQTAMFITADAANVPTLQTGYPTFAAALTQALLGYTTTWIGKWHLSDGQPNTTTPGQNGPDDYSFNGAHNLPSQATNKNVIYSPNGLATKARMDIWVIRKYQVRRHCQLRSNIRLTHIAMRVSRAGSTEAGCLPPRPHSRGSPL